MGSKVYYIMVMLNFGAGLDAQVWIRPEDGAWSVLADGRLVSAGLGWGEALALGEAIMQACRGPARPEPGGLSVEPGAWGASSVH